MYVEVDQSGKIEQTNMDTVVAFSNDCNYVVLLSKNIKRKLINKYRKDKQIILKLFVICIFYAIKDFLHEMEVIMVDNEYEGKQDYMKSLLLTFIRKYNFAFDRKFIKFSCVTKKSNAHKIALNVKRSYSQPQRKLSEQDIEKMIQGA